MMSTRRQLIKNQLWNIFTGFVFWLPIGVLVIAGSFIIGNLENVGKDFLSLFLPDERVYTGLGTLLWILIFYLTGLILKETSLGDFLSRIPVLGLFFRRRGVTITPEKLLGLTPCLFLYSPTCPSYGWILGEQDAMLGSEKSKFQMVNVYYPNVPTLVTGQVFSVRKETVVRLGNPSRDIIDVLLYGFRKPENLEYLPWEDETEQDFYRRMEHFGID